jgi:hypothetical protein
MDTEQDFWFYLAVFVSVVAMFMWALSSTVNLGSGWVPWVASAVIVAALGSVSVRAWFRPKGVVPTGQSKETKLLAIRHETIQLLWRAAYMLLLFWGGAGLKALVDNGWLPMWAGAIIDLVFLAGWIWVGLSFRRRTRSVKQPEGEQLAFDVE